jgi:protein-S-isoprenylcysteine O-methyltransferase Ste14
MASGSARRWVVPGVFLVLAVFTAAHAVSVGARTVAHPSLHAWLHTAYAVLRAVVAGAFAVLTVGRAAPHRPSRSPLAFVACAAAMTAVVAFRDPPAHTPPGLILTGALIAVASCLWLVFAISYLGRCFGVLPEARGLVTHGPYGIMRHPVYLGEFGACLGLLMAAPTVLNVVAFAVLAAGQTVRMRMEEQALTAAFSDYAGYAACVPRLIPALPRLRQTRLEELPGTQV